MISFGVRVPGRHRLRFRRRVMRVARLHYANDASSDGERAQYTATATPNAIFEAVGADECFMISHLGSPFRAADEGGTTSDE